jgi:hypothetical protein
MDHQYWRLEAAGPIEFFLTMAWDPKAVSKDRIAEWTHIWAAREFGPAHAQEIATLVSRYAKYNAWRKPEQLRPDTYSLENFDEAERMVALWLDLRSRAEAINDKLPETHKAAYYQLVLHPIRGCCNLTQMQVAAARNKRFAEQARASTNEEAEEVKRLFSEAHAIRDTYNHDLSNGKWNHLMDQTYIGYFDWYQPVQDIRPPVSELDLPDTSQFGVAVQGARQGWPGYYLAPNLPVLDSLYRPSSWIETFPRGKRPVDVQLVASEPWIILKQDTAFSVGKADRRHRVEIDWRKLPPGRSTGTVKISNRQDSGSAGAQSVTVTVTAIRASAQEERAAKGCWGSLAGAFSIPASDYARNVPADGVQWGPIPDYGRVDAAMSIFPVNAASMADPKRAPRLEYPIFVGEAGEWTFDLVTAPTLKVDPNHALSLALWVDDGPPQIVTVFSPENRESEEFLGKASEINARNDMRIMRFKAMIAKPGRHVLTVAMVDPTIVLQTIIAHRDTLPTSYFGPPAKKIA